VVVIGGGTGTFVVLSGLKHYPLNLTAVVSVADSGGSTGRLRDEFGFQPVGDLRQALAALAQNQPNTWIQDLLLYRFRQGSALAGHNLGNLILTALQDLSGSTAQAVEIAHNIFRLHGHIYPSTIQKVDLVVEYSDGSFVIGEHHLNSHEPGGKKIRKVRLSPSASLYPAVKTSLDQADLVVLGPGDIYASIMPNLVVKGMKPSLQKTPAKILYIVNLMTSFTQTHNLTAKDHVSVIESAVGRSLDYIIVNRTPISASLLKAYQKQHEFPVIDNLGNDPRVIRSSLITAAKVKPLAGDQIIRSYLRHDSAALAKQIYTIIK
jgi:uncharacterized cofD-like protein